MPIRRARTRTESVLEERQRRSRVAEQHEDPSQATELGNGKVIHRNTQRRQIVGLLLDFRDFVVRQLEYRHDLSLSRIAHRDRPDCACLNGYSPHMNAAPPEPER
jgi:hypothetical protein